MEALYKSLFKTPQRKIIAIGKNYRDHIAEMKSMFGDEVPKDPVVFTKPFTTAVLPGEPIKLRHDREIHHEIELGVMIGKRANCVSQDVWREHVGGYFLLLDLTDRILQKNFKDKGLPWDLSKGQDYFMPVSDFVAADAVVDPHNLELELRINGDTKQKGSTGLMIYQIPYLIEYVSNFMTLNEGDLILTGTPEGVGPIAEGDKLEGYLRQANKDIATFVFNVEK